MPSPMRSKRGALLLLAAIAAAGCSPIAVPGPEGDNSLSGPWHGDYAGAGCFTNPAFVIENLDVQVTVRITDIGDNHIRIALFVSPQNAAYSPVLHLEGPLTRPRQAELVMLDEVTYHHASLVRTDDGELSGTLWVTSLADGLYWKCTIEAVPDPAHLL